MRLVKSDTKAPWRKHLTPAEARKVKELDAMISVAEVSLRDLRRRRAAFMRRANTRRYRRAR